MQLALHSFDLKLRHVFRISRGAIDTQPTLIVELRQGDQCGYGEATTNDYYGFTLENMKAAIEAVRADIEGWTLETPEAFWEALQPGLADNPFALCALDQAAHDLWGKLAGKPVYQLWGLDARNCVPTDYTIGIDTLDVMRQKLAEFPDWPIYKIKLGTDHDLEIIQQLREQTDAVFRVDANCGWTPDETIENAARMKPLKVEFIEQPLPADQWDAMRRVVQESALPIIADESCIEPEDVARCQGHFHGINIKLPKCGGMTPARRMIHDARQRDLRVMIGCMTESSVGIAAIAQLLPLLDYVDMDGALLLAEDIADGVDIVQGQVHFPDRPGNGVRLK